MLVAENLQSARCLPVVFSNVLAARKRNVMTARAQLLVLAYSQMLAKTIRYPFQRAGSASSFKIITRVSLIFVN